MTQAPQAPGEMTELREQLDIILGKHLTCSGGNFYVKGIQEALDEIMQTLQAASQTNASSNGSPSSMGVEQFSVPPVGSTRDAARDAEIIEKCAQVADNAKRPVGYTYMTGQIADDIARRIRSLSPAPQEADTQ